MITDGGPGASERLRIEFEDRILPALERAMSQRFGPLASHDTIVSGAWSALRRAERDGDWTPNLDDPFWGLYHFALCKIVDRVRPKHLEQRRPMPPEVVDLSAADLDGLADSTLGGLIEEVVGPLTDSETAYWEGLKVGKSREQIAADNGWDPARVDALRKSFKTRLTPDEWRVWKRSCEGLTLEQITQENREQKWTNGLVESLARQIRRKIRRRFDPYLEEFHAELSDEERVVWDRLRSVDLEGKRAQEKIEAVAAEIGRSAGEVRRMAIAIGRRLSRFYVDRFD